MGKFRFHRGSLDDAMATQFEFTDKTDLINKIRDKGYSELTQDTFKCSFYAYDDRIKENTHLVAYNNGNTHYVIGMADCMVE